MEKESGIPTPKPMHWRDSHQIQLELSENLTIAPLQHFSCSKRPSSKDIKQDIVKTLSRNKIQTSIKGHDIVTNAKKKKKKKKMGNNSNLDLVNMNAYIKFGEFLSIGSQDIERKRNFGYSKGHKFEKNDMKQSQARSSK